MSETPAAPAGIGDPVWDDWDTPLLAPDVPVLHLDGFDGPMDLLLDFAERQRIDLGRVSIVALAEQFVAALQRLADRVPIERRADWLVTATRLVLLRSRLLCPATPEAAAAAVREAAAERHRIDERSFLRAATAWLEAQPQLGRDVFTRPPAHGPRVTGYVALMEACLVVLRGREARPAGAPVYRPVIPPLWRVPDALARLRAMLADHPEGGELRAFFPPLPADARDRPLKARAAVASTLVAGLELARAGEATAQQEESFAAIVLRAASPVP